MKKIFATILPLAALLAMSSCSEDFITRDKPLTVTEEIVFNDPDFIEADLLDCYSIFKGSYPTFMGGNGFVAFDSRGDDIVNVSNAQTQQETYEMRVLPTSIENGRIWDYAYSTINSANLFADKLESKNCKELLGEETYNQYIAEARFLRAYCYYVLCQLFSTPYKVDPDALAVPLRLEGIEGAGYNDCPRSSIGTIYNQILEDCMPDALPDASYDAEGVARATKAAAHLLKMRVYMAMEEWDSAITEGEAITGYELAADVNTLYGKGDVFSSKEMIFALPSTTQDHPNTQQAAVDYFAQVASVSWLDTESGVMSDPAYFLPSDARISNLVEGPDANGYYYSTKFMDYGSSLDWVPLMRYAEVKLNLAECYVNKADGVAKAKQNLKDVRRRSIAAAADVIDVDALSGAALKNAVYNERRLEFICEGMRGIDIARRGENFVKSNSFVNLNVAPDASNYVWPIPASEGMYNKAINRK